MKRAAYACVFLSATALADDGWYPYTPRPLDFNVRFSQHTVDLDYDGTRVDTSVDRVGVAWRERFGERLQLGLFGGYSALTQTDNPDTAGRRLHGYHAGFSLDLDLLTLERAALFLGAAWLYEKVDEDDGAQRVALSWNEPSVRLGASGLIGGALQLYGGVRYGVIDGRQRLSGALNETRPIEQADRSGGFAGLELILDRDGYAGAVVESGLDRSVALYFGRRF